MFTISEGTRTCTIERGQDEHEKVVCSENIVYLTGDTHGQFRRIAEFCKQIQHENTLIILGDVGLNYFGDYRDWPGKTFLSHIHTTFFCVHGNHEQRLGPHLGYELREFHGGKVWVETSFPNIVFAIDGEVYNFCGHSCLVIGGAYSVDKYYRLEAGMNWWPDEQPDDAVKARVEQALDARDWKVDVVLSHTCPLQYEPTEVFLPTIDQSRVDKTTEAWLDRIEQQLQYERWYCGHYHIKKTIGKMRFMFDDYTFLPHILSLDTERANNERSTHEKDTPECIEN